MAVDPDEFIQINQVLNMKPSLGPIPADQMLPWATITLGNIIVVKSLLGMNWIITILSIGWGIATWWLLTGSDSSKFLSKFHKSPFWMYGQAMHFTPLEPHPELIAAKDKAASRRQRKQRQRRRKRLKIQR